jgi:DNA-binding SARP family transcriptional activator
MDFRVLGTLEVWSGEARIALPSARHQRVLAALLLAPNRVVPITGLVAAMWNDEPPATATKQVRNCVSALRERLGGGSSVIVTDGPGYGVVLADEELDMLRFRRGFDRAQRLATDANLFDAVAEGRRALQLWRGPALDGLEADALIAPISRLDEQRANAMALCLGWRLQLGESHEVVAELTELVAQHPLNERLHAQLMVALDRSGRQAEALAVFHGIRARLVDELGVDPGAELQRSYAAVLAGTERRPPPATAAEQTYAAQMEAFSAPVSRAMEHLAAAVRRHWTDDVDMRLLNRPQLVALRWCRTARPVSSVAAADPVEHPPAGRLEQPVPSGVLNDTAAAFRQIQPRQMVVLGEPGAGKTVVAILLTLALLDE